MAKRKEKYAVTINGYKYYRCMVNGEVILEKTLEAMEQKRERLIRTKERIGSNYTDITIGQYSKDWYIEKAQDIFRIFNFSFNCNKHALSVFCYDKFILC